MTFLYSSLLSKRSLTAAVAFDLWMGEGGGGSLPDEQGWSVSETVWLHVTHIRDNRLLTLQHTGQLYLGYCIWCGRLETFLGLLGSFG